MKSNPKPTQLITTVEIAKPIRRKRAAYGEQEVFCVDLAKNFFHVNRYTANGESLSSKTVSRAKFDALVRDPQRPRALFVMEACGTSTFWGQILQARGDQVKLVPPQFVAKQRIGNKTDRNDAEAIYAVHMDQRVHPVPLKTPEQQDQVSLHSTRDFLVKTKLSVGNHLRALLSERGFVTAKGNASLWQLLDELTEINTPLSLGSQPLVVVLKAMLEAAQAHVDTLDEKVKEHARESEAAQRLMEVPGIGPITSSASVAEHADLNRFSDARQFAATYGSVPGEHSSGGKQRHGGITKRGNAYHRRLLTQCAQNVLNVACPSPKRVSNTAPEDEKANKKTEKTDDIYEFARRLRARKPRQVVVMAIVNRLARIIYVILKHGVPYRPNRTTATA
jgi:transposase